LVVPDLVGQLELLEQPQHALRARIVQMVDGDHGRGTARLGAQICSFTSTAPTVACSCAATCGVVRHAFQRTPTWPARGRLPVHGDSVSRVASSFSTLDKDRSMNKRQLLALAILPAMLAACGGNDGVDDRTGSADPKVRLVHAIPGAPAVNLFRDGQNQ